MKRYEGSGAGEIGITLEGASSLDRSVEMWVRVNMRGFSGEWSLRVATIGYGDHFATGRFQVRRAEFRNYKYELFPCIIEGFR